jgi:hypothetical protein
MLSNVLVALCALVTVLVLWVQGIDGFTIWNLTPVIAVVGVLAVNRRLRTSLHLAPPVPQAVFCFLAIGCVALVHLAWQFDWGRMATASSTSGLIFIFAPVYSFGIAAIGAGIAWVGINAAHRRGA